MLIIGEALKAFLVNSPCGIYAIKVKYIAKSHILKNSLSLLEITWDSLDTEKLLQIEYSFPLMLPFPQRNE